MGSETPWRHLCTAQVDSEYQAGLTSPWWRYVWGTKKKLSTGIWGVTEVVVVLGKYFFDSKKRKRKFTSP